MKALLGVATVANTLCVGFFTYVQHLELAAVTAILAIAGVCVLVFAAAEF
jgi:hypothetical protein